MKTDDMAFFHEGTLRICGSLNIDVVLRRCLEFLKGYMPLSGILLDIYEKEIGALRNVALISDIPLQPLNRPITLSRQERQLIEAQTQKGVLVDDADRDPISIQLSTALGLKRVCYLVLHLKIQDERLGVVVVFGRGKNCFQPEHRRLLELLHDPFAIAMSNTLRFRELSRLKERLKDDNRYLFQELHQLSGDEIVGERFGLKQVMDMVRQVARLDSNVLLLGETGVGKEVIANAIHFSSPRGSGPLIKVNCGAIPENLIDSELFGHEKGAFTGAVAQKRGRFERADAGTLFLDEVAELQPNAQVRLLRTIQDRRIERVGGDASIPVDVRLICATNRNLEERVRAGKFREDLWFRLNVFPITIPPLRQRREDIPALVHYFIEKKSHDMKLPYRPQPAPGSLDRLKRYDWPGNVRELENIVERELIRSRTRPADEPLAFLDFEPLQRTIRAETTIPGRTDTDKNLEIDRVMRAHLQHVLQLSGGRIQGRYGAAAKLGLNPSTLRHRLRKLGIPFGYRALSETE